MTRGDRAPLRSRITFARRGGLAMPPTKLAHVVFQTNRLKDMSAWYCQVLGGHVIYENPHLSFVTYDDEHHRVAFIDFGPLAARDPGAGSALMVKATDQPGLHHVAFRSEERRAGEERRSR